MSAPPLGPSSHFLRALPGVERLGLAVSGGPDSVAMLLIAAEALPGRIAVATVDHGLRAAAAAEAAFVAGLCAARGIPHTILTAAVAAEGKGLQAAARAARYRLLARWCAASGLGHLATAHHADDQAETLLMRLGRGAGLAGLGGIRRRRPLGDGVTLIRPLLDVTRAELAAIVAAAGIVAVDDPSNRDPRYDRTRARALLAAGYPAARRVAAAAAHLAEAEAALAWAADGEWDRRQRREDGGTLAIDVAGLPEELRRRLVQRALTAIAAEAAPRGPDLARFIGVLAGGGAATIAGVRGAGGAVWRFAPAPPRRAN